jgi:hypothetical protein
MEKELNYYASQSYWQRHEGGGGLRRVISLKVKARHIPYLQRVAIPREVTGKVDSHVFTGQPCRVPARDDGHHRKAAFTFAAGHMAHDGVDGHSAIFRGQGLAFTFAIGSNAKPNWNQEKGIGFGCFVFFFSKFGKKII